MKKISRKLKKVLLIIIISLLSIVVLIIAFISPITKYAIEKYSVKYTGRQIKMDWAYVNPFTGYAHLHDLIIYEPKSDSIFFSIGGLSTTFDVLKLFSKKYEITGLTLDKPWLKIIQNKKEVNLIDFIDQFASKDTTDTTQSAVNIKLLNLKITGGEIHYEEQLIPINYFIRDFNFESEGLKHDVDTMNGKLSFKSGPSHGEIKADFSFNLKTLYYRMAVLINNFDMQILEQYLKDLARYGRFSANLDANIHSIGNFHDETDMTSTGEIKVSDFHFGKEKGADYLSFEQLMWDINEISPKNKKYFLDSITLTHPILVFEQYDYLNNVEKMFGRQGVNIERVKGDPHRFNLIIEIANYIQEISKEFFRGNYKVDRVAIYDGDFTYNDYTPREKFSVAANPITITADSIDKQHQRADFTLKSGIKPYGRASVEIKVNPEDAGDFDMVYRIEKLPLPLFNPYFISYTSFPVDRGAIEINGTWKVRGGKLDSDNHLLIIDSRAAKRLKKKDAKWLPLPFILSLMRDEGNVMDYEIPITGDLKSPKFHLRDVIRNIIENIFIKPVTTPYRTHVKKIERELEKAFTFKWEMRQTILRNKQERFISKMADFLESNPEAVITVYPYQYALKEKEYILFFEAKKKYFLQTRGGDAKSFSEDDSIFVDKMSNKDSLFVGYLNKHIPDSMLFTIQEKCRVFVGSKIINTKFTQLVKARKNVFISYFKKNNADSRVTFHPNENTIPFYGFSYYKIDYKGDLPKSLAKAFQEMNELNDDYPRKKYTDERKRIGILLEDKEHVK